jgi:hypothetical protein
VTYPNQQQQPPASPRPGPPPGGFRPAPPPGGFRPGPPPQAQPAPAYRPDEARFADDEGRPTDRTQGTGHPAVDAVLQSLANAATLAPADQIAEYEAAHQVLQETLASIDR